MYAFHVKFYQISIPRSFFSNGSNTSIFGKITDLKVGGSGLTAGRRRVEGGMLKIAAEVYVIVSQVTVSNQNLNKSRLGFLEM